MANPKVNFKTEKELQEAILQGKARGTSDLEIGQKYGVTFRYIEQLITKTQGLNISALKVFKKINSKGGLYYINYDDFSYYDHF
ncbi:MAG: hypothetical protein QME68_04840 [Elusimicrobiota bacterium]|nr:hypothetical protein [Elusimicrobiota bacterium]